MDRKERKSEVATDIPVQPLILADLVHVKTPEHRIIDCKQTSIGKLGKRPSTYHMKVSNYEIEYTGQTHISDRPKNNCDWVMAVRNRRTGKIVFAPFEHVSFNADIEVPEEVRNRITKVDSSNFAEMRRNLILEFGTKKAKQALNSSLRNAVDEKATEQLFAHAMNYMQENVQTKRPKLEDGEAQGEDEAGPSGQSKVQTSSALPPFNAEAKEPSEIYSLSDIVHDDLLEVLKPEAERFLLLSPKEAKEEGHCPLVMAIIQMTASMKNMEERSTRVAYCLYLSYLIRLNKLIGGHTRLINPSALTEDPSIPSSIASDLISKFTSAGGGGSEARAWRSMGKLSIAPLHKDALLARIVVMLLILSGQYAFNMQKALQDLGASDGKVTEFRLTSVCKALGCKFERHQKTGSQICILDKPPKQMNALLKKAGMGRGRGRGRGRF